MWNKPSFSSDQPHAKPRRRHSQYQKDQEKVEKYDTNLDQGGMSRPPQARVQNGQLKIKHLEKVRIEGRARTTRTSTGYRPACLPLVFTRRTTVFAATAAELYRGFCGGAVPRRHLSRHANLTLALSILLKGPNIHDVHFICHDVLCMSTTYMPSFG